MIAPIRRALAVDQSSLIATIDDVCGECHWMATSRFEPTPMWQHALDHSDCERHVLLVVQAREGIVGWCRILLDDCTANLSRAELGIGLVKGYRGRGIGTALLRNALYVAAEIGFDRIILSVHPDNAVARHLFRRCGFHDIGMGPDGYARMTRQCVSSNMNLGSYQWSSVDWARSQLAMEAGT